MSIITVRLAKAVEPSLRAGHPWVYRAALATDPGPPAGAEVRVLDRRGRPVGRGWADEGPIAVRMWSSGDRPVDAELLRERLAGAASLRDASPPPDTDCLRLLHGEGDRAPGVVVDRYADVAVLKLDGAAAAAHLSRLRAELVRWLPARGVRSLLLRAGARGERAELLWGPTPPAQLVVRERGMRLLVNPWRGQKTGLFLDHRESRARVRGLAAGRAVLNLYGYTGGFSVAAALGGARAVTTVDLAKPALALARESFDANELSVPHRVVAADVPAFLKAAAQTAERYELVIADPPNFAPNEASKPAALRSYAALHAAALSLLEPGGLYLAASCSSHVRAHELLETLQHGARKARRVLQVLEQSGAPYDHPRLVAFPEGDYLKVLLCRCVTPRAAP